MDTTNYYHYFVVFFFQKLIGEEGEEMEKKVDDIDDPNFYSIELEKQKAEHDRMVKLAEEKKQVETSQKLLI